MRFQRNNKWWWTIFLWAYELSMVNSYVAMKRYCELKGVKMRWTHHDWNEAIGYAHLDPVEDWPRRKSPGKLATNDARGATVTSEVKKRNSRMDSMALSPTRGRLNFRLDHSSMVHVPVPSNINTPACQLHCWAYQELQGDRDQKKRTPQGARAQVVLCEACNVHLCIPCWKLYHFERDLAPHISRILGKS